MNMKFFRNIIFPVLLLSCSCVTKFIPEPNENAELLVVDGQITNQPEPDTIRIYKSMPLVEKVQRTPVYGCTVMIQDDLGNSYYLSETNPGTFVTDPGEFCGIVGRKYTLKIFTNGASEYNYSYESYPMEMKPVPPIEKIYYEKTVIEEASEDSPRKEGCQIYLNTSDSQSGCRFYKWDYSETWEMKLPFDVINDVCWISKNSGNISVKNTSTLSENRIEGHPLLFISNETDRLAIKYSVLVNQYSLNEEEYNYWSKLKAVTENVGSLYDITPASVKGNIFCVEDPQQVVLGYFSVSARTSKRIFITDTFSGRVNRYAGCINEKFSFRKEMPNLNKLIWLIIDCGMCRPPYYAYTYDKSCADCTVRGTDIKPAYWDDDK